MNIIIRSIIGSIVALTMSDMAFAQYNSNDWINRQSWQWQQEQLIREQMQQQQRQHEQLMRQLQQQQQQEYQQNLDRNLRDTFRWPR